MDLGLTSCRILDQIFVSTLNFKILMIIIKDQKVLTGSLVMIQKHCTQLILQQTIHMQLNDCICSNENHRYHAKQFNEMHTNLFFQKMLYDPAQKRPIKHNAPTPSTIGKYVLLLPVNIKCIVLLLYSDYGFNFQSM